MRLQLDRYAVPVVEQHVMRILVISHTVAVYQTVILLNPRHQEVQYAYHVNGLELVE